MKKNARSAVHTFLTTDLEGVDIRARVEQLRLSTRASV